MKKIKISLLLGLLLFIALHFSFAQQQTDIRQKKEDIQYDQFGRKIKEGDKQFEFTADKQPPQQLKSAGQAQQKQLQYKDNQMDCEPNWKQAVMGTCIGLNSMNSDDFDNDGKTEIICSGGSGFGGGYFWYILQYNSVSGEYEFEWISDYYESNYNSTGISVITYFDLGNDGLLEICCGLSDGTLLIYDGESMEIIQTIESEAGAINSIYLADADNDGTDEIVFCDDETTYLFNASNFIQETTLQYGADYFEPGNVDADPETELVYSSGDIISYSQGTVTYIWDFLTGSGYQGHLSLSDIDSDGMEEVIFAQYWYYITVYDVDLQSPKYQIESDLDIDALLLYDVNADGVDEILYGDGQWGDIYCHDAVTTQLIWSIPNPEHGTTEINVADADNDGQLEVMWGAGCSSTGSDHLFIHEIPSCNFEYKTKHLDPPFYTIEIGDVDDDGTQEIVTISCESNSGYDSGIMTIFNSTDHSVEWQSDENYFQSVWTGIFASEIADIDDDGETEIIVAAGSTYTGQMWIINGATHDIESNYVFYAENIDEFYTLDVADVDDDGQMECVVSETGYVHVINPADYSVEWSSVNLQGYYTPRAIYVDNVDSDANQEIISCQGYIYIIDGITHQQWQSVASNYNNIDIYDINGDGIKDIVACNSFGQIIAIDGQTQETSVVFSQDALEIDGIKIDDITGDGEFDYIFSSEGAIYFRTQSGQEMNTQAYGLEAGSFDGLKISDYNQDGWKEIFAGTNYIAIELGKNCYTCLDFNIEVTGEDISCDPGGDGSVEVIATGGEEPYTYAWSFGGTSSFETGLEAGTYTVTVTDNQGCEKSGVVTISQAQLITDVITKKVGCAGVNDGMAEVEILEGHPPYQFSWSTGATSQQISGLAVGNYEVTITDGQNCVSAHNVVIAKDTVICQVFTDNIDCYGYENGYASIQMYEGEPPFTYNWSNGYTGNSSNTLPADDYSVTITDDLSCLATLNFVISEPDEIHVMHTVTPDDPATTSGEGTATLSVTGGVPPYYYQWYDPFYQTNQTAINLVSGEYTVSVTDINQCEKTHVLFIPEVNWVNDVTLLNQIKIHPNPASEKLILDCDFAKAEEMIVTFINSAGKVLFETTFSQIASRELTLDVGKYPGGFYTLKIEVNGKLATWKINLL